MKFRTRISTKSWIVLIERENHARIHFYPCTDVILSVQDTNTDNSYTDERLIRTFHHSSRSPCTDFWAIRARIIMIHVFQYCWLGKVRIVDNPYTNISKNVESSILIGVWWDSFHGYVRIRKTVQIRTYPYTHTSVHIRDFCTYPYILYPYIYIFILMWNTF